MPLATLGLLAAVPAVPAFADVACGTAMSPPPQAIELLPSQMRRAPVPRGAAGLDIVITAGSGLSANAQALAAFQRAARQWEALFTDPVTITISGNLANLGSPATLGQTVPVVLTANFDAIRSTLVSDANDEADDAIVASLPTAAQVSFQVPPGFTVSGLGTTKANFKALGFTGLDAMFGASDGAITFNTQFPFDYDNSNGVTAGTYDFETIASHEIGHLLGFHSVVDTLDQMENLGQTGTRAAQTLDLLRFRTTATNPTASAQFTTFSRSATYGTTDITDDLFAEYRMSTGAHNGDGRQASHWRDDELSGLRLGLMDPTFGPAQAWSIAAADIRALDLIGYDYDRCGNGELDPTEQCDDGNDANGDCCSSACRYESAGAACTADANQCTNDTCNGTGTCQAAHRSGACEALFCTTGDFCFNGACVPSGPSPCAGGNECNDVCNEAARTCQTPNGTACTDDGNACTNDTCSAGACVHTNNTNACTDDGNACTNDTCSGGACVHTNNTSVCSDDGNVCTNDVCSGGACTHPANTGPCNDGLYCNGADTCQGGTCSAHAGSPCTGGHAVCGACNEAADSCAQPNGTACDDGSFCNGTDSCQAGACAAHSGDPCAGLGQCAATCDEAADDCNAPAGTACSSDDEICTDDACDGGGTCAHTFDVANDPVCQANVCPAVPEAGCRAAAGTSLSITDDADATRDALTWRWKKGQETSFDALGHPFSDTAYFLCLYLDDGAGPSRAASLIVEAGPGWQSRIPRGWSYRDADGSPSGVVSLQAGAGADGKAKMQWKAAGSWLELPPAEGATFFDAAATVIVQARTSDGTCWTSAFAAEHRKTNTAQRFKAGSGIVCGDYTASAGETCDGADDGACTGGCRADCSCEP